MYKDIEKLMYGYEVKDFIFNIVKELIKENYNLNYEDLFILLEKKLNNEYNQCKWKLEVKISNEKIFLKIEKTCGHIHNVDDFYLMKVEDLNMLNNLKEF